MATVPDLEEVREVVELLRNEAQLHDSELTFERWSRAAWVVEQLAKLAGLSVSEA